jgi:hypothetical protein
MGFGVENNNWIVHWKISRFFAWKVKYNYIYLFQTFSFHYIEYQVLVELVLSLFLACMTWGNCKSTSACCHGNVEYICSTSQLLYAYVLFPFEFILALITLSISKISISIYSDLIFVFVPNCLGQNSWTLLIDWCEHSFLSLKWGQNQSALSAFRGTMCFIIYLN